MLRALDYEWVLYQISIEIIFFEKKANNNLEKFKVV